MRNVDNGIHTAVRAYDRASIDSVFSIDFFFLDQMQAAYAPATSERCVIIRHIRQITNFDIPACSWHANTAHTKNL